MLKENKTAIKIQLLTTDLLIIKPPLKDFWDSDFFRAFIILKKSQTFFTAFIISKKSACGGLLLFSNFLSSKFDLWKVDFFLQKSCFCLVKHRKIVRLRHAKNARFLLTSWKKFRLRRALIILKFLSQIFRGSYYSQNFISKFSKFLLFLK